MKAEVKQEINEYVVLTLSRQEAETLAFLLGNIGGSGKVRAVNDAIFAELCMVVKHNPKMTHVDGYARLSD